MTRNTRWFLSGKLVRWTAFGLLMWWVSTGSVAALIVMFILINASVELISWGVDHHLKWHIDHPRKQSP